MWWSKWHVKKEISIPDDVLEKREIALRLHSDALGTAKLAVKYSRKLEKIRSENHIVAAINMRKSP